MRQLPQIDAQIEFNSDPAYAAEILDNLLRFYTLDQISAHSGISRRSISYLRHKGFHTMPDQITLEILAEVRKLS